MSLSRRYPSSSPSPRQRGFTLLGLLFWGGIIAVLAVVAMKVFPTVVEYYTVKKIIDRVAASNPPTVPAARQAFEQATQVEYGVESIKSSDLSISKDNDKVVIEFAYDKQIGLFGPVYLLIKYQGKSR